MNNTKITVEALRNAAAYSIEGAEAIEEVEDLRELLGDILEDLERIANSKSLDICKNIADNLINHISAYL